MEKTYNVRVVDEMTGAVLIDFYSISERLLDELYANMDVMQSVEIIN